jgi:hypothetical protein
LLKDRKRCLKLQKALLLPDAYVSERKTKV